MSKLSPSCFLFAGPTLYGIEALRRLQVLPVKCLPPVRRGDIQALIAQSKPAVIVIVDGVFHQYPAVGHYEIRLAIECGWRVWGLASMGAIRACEMAHVGMLGFGEVYERFRRDEDFRDDEVALIHWAEPPYRSVTEPLIHIRVALCYLVEQGVLEESDANVVAGKLAEVWFGYRTLAELRRLIRKRRPDIESGLIDGWLKDFERFRIKSWDLWNFIQECPWRTEA